MSFHDLTFLLACEMESRNPQPTYMQADELAAFLASHPGVIKG